MCCYWTRPWATVMLFYSLLFLSYPNIFFLSKEARKIDSLNISWQIYSRDEHIFQTSRSYLEILGARRVTCNKFHTQGPQILGATVKSLVATATCCPRFVHPWCIPIRSIKWNKAEQNKFTRAGRPVDRIRCGRNFSHPSRTALGPPSLLYYGYRVSFPAVKRPGVGVDHPPHPVQKLKKE
jgi:hypothetical protein